MATIAAIVFVMLCCGVNSAGVELVYLTLYSTNSCWM